MAKTKSRVPNRGATRRPDLRIVDGGKPVPPATAVPSATAAHPRGDDACFDPHGGDEATGRELVASLTQTLLAGLTEVRTAFGAEVMLSGIFGAVTENMPEGADDDEVSAALTVMLAQIIEYAATVATPDALALLRVTSRLGPSLTQSLARAVAEQLHATGVPDRPWVARLGTPTMLRAWRYGDIYGSQFSVGVLFHEQGREHALMVLMDNLLGGGVKDCWVAEGRSAKGIRDSIAATMINDPDAYFEDMDAATTATLLREALANPPCPEQEDQLEDVATYLFLLRSRTAHLAQLAGLPATSESSW